MKVLQIKVRRLKQFGCSLKLLANVQCTLTRKRSVLLIPASYFTNLEKKEHKCFKKSTVFILHFAPSLRFTVSLHFTPGPQSAFYTDRIQTLLFVQLALNNKQFLLQLPAFTCILIVGGNVAVLQLKLQHYRPAFHSLSIGCFWGKRRKMEAKKGES